MNNRPDFLVICTDQQRSDSLGCAGNARARTPHIDSIAENGVRFDRHSTPMQICSPSRATMLTGLYPRHHRLAVNGMALPADVPTVTDTLVRNGYRTHGVGKQHLQPLLAPAKYAMPDSRAFWQSPGSETWNGPYYGYQTVDLLLGESDTAHLAGHYARWLKENHPESVAKLLPESASEAPPTDLDEIWRSPIAPDHHYNSWIADRAIEFLEQEEPGDESVFLFVSFPDPHHPFDPPIPYADRFSPETMPLPEVTDEELKSQPGYYGELYPKGEGFRELYWAGRTDLEAGSMITTESISDDSMRRAIAYTHAMNAMIDDQVGRILGALQRSGRADNTVVIFTTDHGELLGDHGLLHKGPPPYRQLTEVSFLVRGPGIPAGRAIDALTSHIDLAPTLLDLAGLGQAGHAFDGFSMVPLMKGNTASLREYDFGEYHPTARMDLYNQTVRTRDWRLTLYPEHPEWGELFDLRKDPGERLNRFADERYSDITKKLRRVLAERFAPMPSVSNEWICKW
jgi:arylsulfatase A-like enzyme